VEIHTVLVTANFQGDHWQRLEAALAPAHIIACFQNRSNRCIDAFCIFM